MRIKSLTLDFLAFGRTLAGADETLEVAVEQTVVVQNLVDVHVVVLGGVLLRFRRRPGHHDRRHGDDGEDYDHVLGHFVRLQNAMVCSGRGAAARKRLRWTKSVYCDRSRNAAPLYRLAPAATLRPDGRTDGPAATERARIAVTSRGRDTHYGAGRTASNRFRNFPTRSARRAPSLSLDIRVKRFVFFSPIKNSGHNFASENADRPGSRTNESKRQIVCVTWIFFYIRILYWPTTMRILTFEFFDGEHSIGGSEFQFHLV